MVLCSFGKIDDLLMMVTTISYGGFPKTETANSLKKEERLSFCETQLKFVK